MSCCRWPLLLLALSGCHLVAGYEGVSTEGDEGAAGGASDSGHLFFAAPDPMQATRGVVDGGPATDALDDTTGGASNPQPPPPDMGSDEGSVLFVTSWSSRGAFGRAKADQVCNEEATTAGLAGNFRAILSDESERARDLQELLRYPIRTPNDRRVKTMDLWDGNGIALPLTLANGTPIDEPTVWTGSTATGERGLTDCESWSQLFSVARGVTSLWTSGSKYWLGNTGRGVECDVSARLYCLQIFP